MIDHNFEEGREGGIKERDSDINLVWQLVNFMCVEGGGGCDNSKCEKVSLPKISDVSPMLWYVELY